MQMNRKKKLFLNSTMGIVSQITVLICGFILTRYLLLYFGSAKNGLVASITHFLSFISLLEMGIGPVIQANLYKPLADKNDKEISRILKSAGKFFNTIGSIFIGYILVLCLVLPVFLSKEFPAWFTVSLIVIISINSFMQYFFGLKYQLLLNADQKSYVQLVLYTITLILNTISAIILMKLGFSIQTVYLATAIIYLARPFGQLYYVKNNYNIKTKINYSEEPIKQKWYGFAQHISSVVTNNVGIVTLTFFSTIENVSVYTVYYNVVYGIQKLVSAASTGLFSLLGDMYAKRENEKLIITFNLIEYLSHTIIVFLFAITMATIVPFVRVYTRGVVDANYIVPTFGILIVAAFASLCIRSVYTTMIFAAGHFQQTQIGAVVTAIINIVISVIVVFKYDLVGVAAGTFIAMFYYTCYCVWYLKNNILYRSPWIFVKYLFTDVLIFFLTMILTRNFMIGTVSYFSWFFLVLKVTVIVVVISGAVSVIFYRKEAKGVIRQLMTRSKK